MFPAEEHTLPSARLVVTSSVTAHGPPQGEPLPPNRTENAFSRASSGRYLARSVLHATPHTSKAQSYTCTVAATLDWAFPVLSRYAQHESKLCPTDFTKNPCLILNFTKIISAGPLPHSCKIRLVKRFKRMCYHHRHPRWYKFMHRYFIIF